MGWIFKSKEEKAAEDVQKQRARYHAEEEMKSEKVAESQRRDEEYYQREKEKIKAGGAIPHTIKKVIGGVFLKSEEQQAREKELRKTELKAYKDQVEEERAKRGRAKARAAYGYSDIYEKEREKVMRQQARARVKAQYGYKTALEKEKLREIRRQAKLQARRDLQGGGVTKAEEDRQTFSLMSPRRSEYGLEAGEEYVQQSPVDMLGSSNPFGSMLQPAHVVEHMRQGKSKYLQRQERRHNPFDVINRGDVMAGMMGKDRYQRNPLDRMNPFYKPKHKRK